MPFQGFPAWFCYRASVMLLCDITAQKVRFSFARHKIVIDRPILRCALLCINPVLSDARSKYRMFDIKKEYAIFGTFFYSDQDLILAPPLVLPQTYNAIRNHSLSQALFYPEAVGTGASTDATLRQQPNRPYCEAFLHTPQKSRYRHIHYALFIVLHCDPPRAYGMLSILLFGLIQIALFHMVIYNSDRLHIGIYNGTAHKFETALFQIFADFVRKRR